MFDQKIIVVCPKCGNQNVIYLIHLNRLIEHELKAQWCDNCKLPYVVEIECNLSYKARTWSCHN